MTGEHALEEGKTCLCKHFGGAKALFYYINLQVNDFAGGQSHAKFSFLRYCPHAPCRYMPG